MKSHPKSAPLPVDDMPPSTTIITTRSNETTTMSTTDDSHHQLPDHHLEALKRLPSFSSATSTEETEFSDDDSEVDSDYEYHDEMGEGHEVVMDPMHAMEIGGVMLDEETEDECSVGASAPMFETLVNDMDQPGRAMSFSVCEEMVEVVPTAMVESVLPIWIKDWNEQRKEWEQLQKAIRLRRSHTHNDINQPFHPQVQGKSLNSPIDVRRNFSEPVTLNRSLSSRKSKHYKYGSHPSQTYPHSRAPNPIVVKSSKKIGKKHARYALTAGMMLGIRESVGGALGVEAEIEIGRWEMWERCWEEEFLMEEGKGDECKANDLPVGGSGVEVSPSCDDTRHSSTSQRTNSAVVQCSNTLTLECQRVSKYKFPPHQFYLGSNTSKPLPHKYKFKVYAPLVFARIRSLFGIEKQPFLHSICGKFNFYEFASNAKSGQFFFYSHDGRYMIKTLTYAESKFLREILPFYYRHLSRYPNTFLTHFYGMYRVCMPHLNNQRLHFIIMKSVFNTEKKIDRVFDLKGSKAGRRSKTGESVGKDLDILEEGMRLKFVRPGAKQAFLEQLRSDATFLARLGIMDYSLLLGVHSCEENGADDITEHVQDQQMKDDVELAEKQQEPCRSNTPFRRGVLKRAKTGWTTKTANDGFKALEDLDQVIVSKPKATKRPSIKIPEVKDKGGCFKTTVDEATLASTSSSSNGSIMSGPGTNRANIPTSNPVTSRSDGGIEGGIKSDDGTVSVQEIYYCGIIDILQYYTARKMGETVVKQATGNSCKDISCVDPESYGKRFVKFISNLAEE